MGATDKKYGFVAVQHQGGGSLRTREYEVDVLNVTAIFPGDVVSVEADGMIAAASANDGPICVGVVMSCMDSNRIPCTPGYLLTLTAGFVLVYDDPNTIFRVQEDGAGTAIADVTGRFATVNHVAGAGDTLTGRSGHTIDSDDVGTGAQFEIVGLYEAPGNAWADAYTEVLVMFNEHKRKAPVAGV